MLDLCGAIQTDFTVWFRDERTHNEKRGREKTAFVLTALVAGEFGLGLSAQPWRFG